MSEDAIASMESALSWYLDESPSRDVLKAALAQDPTLESSAKLWGWNDTVVRESLLDAVQAVKRSTLRHDQEGE